MPKETNGNFPYDSRAVANCFVRRAVKEDFLLDLMKLLKLVYFAHGFATLKFEGRLINEQFQAWKYGPVAPHLYRRFRDENKSIFIKAPLDEKADEDFSSSAKRLKRDEGTTALLEGVYEKYSHFPPFELSEETHGEASPWRLAARRAGYWAPILQEDIEAYFRNGHRLSEIGLS